jgi:phosphate transport system substrate-binding protein
MLVVGSALCGAVYYTPIYMSKPAPPPTENHLHTGGTSVVALTIENRWRGIFQKAKGIKLDYESTGSSEGIDRMIDGTYAIGFSHTPMTEGQKKKAHAKGGKVLQIPVALCAVVPIYNVKELKDKPPLHFTGPVLADIFLGKIERWNDPALKLLNKGVELPDTKITVVHREDSSGTTFLFASYLSETSAAWKKEVGPAKSKIDWPVGVAMPRNTGVASHVWETNGAIGYVDLIYVIYLNLNYGAMQNRDQTAFIHAKEPNITAALSGLVPELPEDLAFSLINRPGKDSYPICGGIWAVCYEAQPTANEKKVKDFLRWVNQDGQKYGTDLSLAPLPKELTERVEQRLQSIKAAR